MHLYHRLKEKTPIIYKECLQINKMGNSIEYEKDPIIWFPEMN